MSHLAYQPHTSIRRSPSSSSNMPPIATPSTTDDSTPDLSTLGDHVEQTTFEQILEMDDDDASREFSKSIVYGFFDQAETTFREMEDAISAKDIKEVTQLGHFLKGSSATLGLTKVKEACEKIQHIGAGIDDSGTVEEPDLNSSLTSIKKTLGDVKRDYNDVVTRFKKFYGEKA
ncbi:hypothetical protein PABG_03087 [Paracoccidioides brasiliensis Pb03]|nr:hypothetical protein PABG_03087 [Paracoccidioides brasiliensis Pb03]